MATRPRRFRASVLALLTALPLSVLSTLSATPAVADSSTASSSTPTTVTADALPTVQVDGVVWSQVVIGNTVYVGGRFTQAQPAGSAAGVGEVARTDMLAYDLTTGALISSFAPTFNAQVLGLAASPDGKSLYAVGDFTTVNGVAKNHVVALDPATGATQTAFAAKTNAGTYAVAATATTVYVGGTFSAANDTTRTKAAAFSASTGALTSWAPAVPDNQVRAIVVSPDQSKVVLAGSFTSLNGSSSPGSGIGAVDAATGTANQPWAVGKLLYNHGTKAAFYSLSSDGTNVYGTGYVYGSTTDGNLEGSFSAAWADGSVNWIEDCHGDTYSIATLGQAAYTASHAHYCSNVPRGFPQTATSASTAIHQRALAFSTAAAGTLATNTYGSSSTYSNFGGQPAPQLLDWYPTLTAGTYTGQDQAAWSVTTAGKYVLYGGEFPSVNGTRQTGLVRFALSSAATNTSGPQISGSNWVPNAVSLSPGTVRLSWQSNWDRDNGQLTYAVYRNGGTTPVYRTTASSQAWWNRPELTFTDTGLTAGATTTYKVKATDAFGNTASSATVSTTASGSGAYPNTVLADKPTYYWPLNQASGTRGYDWAGTDDLSLGTGITSGASGALKNDSSTGSTFSGASTAFGVTTNQITGPNTFTIEAWFRTTSTAGGKIVGFGNAEVGNSGNYDRHVYMDAQGHVYFGVYPNATRTLQSAATYNDGKWHQVVASLSSAGMVLSVDGTQLGSRTDTTSAQSYTGWWRVGGDTSWSGAADFTGDIQNVAIYPTALTAAQISRHYAVATGTASAGTPSASMTATVNGATAAFDGTGSTDAGGTIAQYGWSFGDGTSATGATASHTYASAGTYTAVLTVTDASGATSSTSKQVTVSGSNQAPTASFTSSVSGLTAKLDASASSDPDGTIASAAWSFGDGTNGSGLTVSHAYSTAGSFTVKLTVTDNGGATATKSATVTVAGPTASFSASASALTASFDGTASSEPGGSVSTWAWAYGDGSTGSGSTATHTYAAAGTYTVTLTVTDAAGATGTATKSVTVAPAVLAQDGFGRTVTSGLGTADTGGAWTVSSGSGYSVSGGAAQLSTTAGSTRSAYLSGVSSTSSDVSAVVAVPVLPAGGSAFGGVVGRRVGSDDYSARLQVGASGSVVLSVLHGSTVLKSATLSGIPATAGGVVHIELVTTGTGTTSLTARAWLDGASAPSAWQVTTSDTTAAMQAAGSVGIRAYLGSGVTNGPLTVSIGSFLAQRV